MSCKAFFGPKPCQGHTTTLYEFWIKELDFSSGLRFSLFYTLHSAHSFWKLLKTSHLHFSIVAFFTNFCLMKNDLSGNTVWQQATGFQKLAKIDHFLAFLMNFWPLNASLGMLNETFPVIFKDFVNVSTNLRGAIFLILNHYSITFDKKREYIPLHTIAEALLRFFWAENPISYKNANSLEENSRHTNWNNCGYKNGSNMGKQ